jgi:hypothetical protein
MREKIFFSHTLIERAAQRAFHNKTTAHRGL